MYCLLGGTKTLVLHVSTHADTIVHRKHPFNKLWLGNQLVSHKNSSVNIAK